MFACSYNMIAVKDPIPCGFRVGLVYKFLCVGCSAGCVSETTRHFSTCICEHMFSDRTSHTIKHLQSSEHCRILCSNDYFSILDYASTTFQLKIKEAIHIQWKGPHCKLQITLHTLRHTRNERNLSWSFFTTVFVDMRL